MLNSLKVHQAPLDDTDHQLWRHQTSGRGGELWDGRTGAPLEPPPLQHGGHLQARARSAAGGLAGPV